MPRRPLTPEQMFEGGTNSYNNWIDFSAGQAFVSGNRAQFQQQHQIPAGAFGGISDFHFQTGIATNTTLTLDGRGIVDNHDYQLSLGIEREKVGYLRLSYEQSRTWSDGDGGYFPGSGQYYAAPNNALALDRGKLSLEGGMDAGKGAKGDLQIHPLVPRRRRRLHRVGVRASAGERSWRRDSAPRWRKSTSTATVFNWM